MRRIITSCLCLLLGISALSAQKLNINRTASEYDSLVSAWMELNNSKLFEELGTEYITLDTSAYHQALSHYTESQYIERLNSIVCPIHLPYNDIVHKHIVAYTTTHQALTKRMLGQGQYYFPMIEAELKRQGLPLELKFIAVVESALQPTARSYMGAVGLWQFMLPTGRQYGLEVTSMIDERRDPVKSTAAACKFFKDMYEIYQDWTLVLAAYNYGPGNVNKAIKRAGSGELTYWDIYPYLPRQTRDYVPAFVGLVYAYNYHKDHNIKYDEPTLPIATDTIMIDRNLHFEQVASTLDTPLELIRALNPQYTEDIVPGLIKPYPLVLPMAETCNFIDNEEIIFAKDSLYIDKRYITSLTPVASGRTRPAGAVASGDTYVVQKGDTLGHIAQRHSTTVAKLKLLNGLSSDKLSIGQKLIIKG